MKFTYSVKVVSDKIQELEDALAVSLDLYQAEGVNDAILQAALSDVQTKMERLKRGIASVVQANEGRYAIIERLNQALRLECEAVVHARSYLPAIEEAGLANRLRECAEHGRSHISALQQQVEEFGGEAKTQVSAPQALPEMTAIEMLEQQKRKQQAVVELYEQALAEFDDPQTRWMFGNAKIDREDHLRELDELIEEYRNKGIVVKEHRVPKWVDPFMGEPGDRPWIE
jgi:bacterioferritin (cytochrome b1)